jgi:hypothetical protein
MLILLLLLLFSINFLIFSLILLNESLIFFSKSYWRVFKNLFIISSIIYWQLIFFPILLLLYLNKFFLKYSKKFLILSKIFSFFITLFSKSSLLLLLIFSLTSLNSLIIAFFNGVKIKGFSPVEKAIE